MKQGRGEMMGTEGERKAGLTKALVLSASFDLMEEDSRPTRAERKQLQTTKDRKLYTAYQER